MRMNEIEALRKSVLLLEQRHADLEARVCELEEEADRVTDQWERLHARTWWERLLYWLTRRPTYIRDNEIVGEPKLVGVDMGKGDDAGYTWRMHGNPSECPYFPNACQCPRPPRDAA